MTQPTNTKPKPVVLPPPRFFIGNASNRYTLVLDLKWGQFEKEINVSREDGVFIAKLIDAINEALLEGTESKPFVK